MIYKALRMAREFHRMKQVDLARRLNISTSYLSEIEAGKKPPSIEILESYARIFDIPASTFLLFEEQAEGRNDQKRVEKARKMLQFFEWILEESDDAGEKKKTTPSRKTGKAVHA